MSFPSYSFPKNHGEADDLSTDFDADTITPDEVPSLSLPPQTATTQLNNNETTTTVGDQSLSTNQSVPMLRRVNSRRPGVPSTTEETIDEDSEHNDLSHELELIKSDFLILLGNARKTLVEKQKNKNKKQNSKGST